MCAAQSALKLEVALNPHQDASLWIALENGLEQPLAALVVDMQASAATRTADRESIVAAMETQHGGTAAAGAALTTQFRSWLLTYARARFQSMPLEQRCASQLASRLAAHYEAHCRFDAAEEVLREQLAANREARGDNNKGVVSNTTLASINNLANFLNSIGELDEAFALYREMFIVQPNTLGAHWGSETNTA